uniref:hypothetical protein n=1 Tax=Photorhabdus sp. RM323S TaxID=3342828 RepID=UPI0036DC2AB0
DASRTDEPWLLWERLNSEAVNWEQCLHNPAWNTKFKYRRKQEMIIVGKVSFPKPVDYELKKGQEYYVAVWSGSINWTGGEMDIELLENGRIHLTKEAAEKHHDALIKISKGEF